MWGCWCCVLRGRGGCLCTYLLGGQAGQSSDPAEHGWLRCRPFVLVCFVLGCEDRTYFTMWSGRVFARVQLPSSLLLSNLSSCSPDAWNYLMFFPVLRTASVSSLCMLTQEQAEEQVCQSCAHRSCHTHKRTSATPSPPFVCACVCLLRSQAHGCSQPVCVRGCLGRRAQIRSPQSRVLPSALASRSAV